MGMHQENLSTEQIRLVGSQLAKDRLSHVNRIQKAAVPATTFYGRYIKRILDVIIASIALALTLPINAVIAVVTFFDVGSPVFFRQKRIGRNGDTFTIVKFRNMRDTYDLKGDLLPPEQRVTKWGKFVRKTSLDELLNFWSILKGDMSLIGPRPLPPIYLDRYSERHRARLTVKPGLECPPRIASDNIWSWDDQFENDIWYVENLSFKTDCRMLVNLVRFALNSNNASARAVASRGSFMGYDMNGAAIDDAQIPQVYIDWAKRNPVSAIRTEKGLSSVNDTLVFEENAQCAAD